MNGIDYSALLEENRKLAAKIEAMENKQYYVGVRNTFKGDCWVRVIGGRPSGEDDILIKGGGAMPVPQMTWEFMLNNENPGVVTGQLVRDDKVLGGIYAGAESFNERERFANMVLDEDIEAWYKLSAEKFKHRLSKLTSPAVLERVLEYGKKYALKKLHHLESAKTRLFELSSPLPDNFDDLDFEELLALAHMLNVPLGKRERDLGGNRVTLKNIILDEMEIRKSNITI